MIPDEEELKKAAARLAEATADSEESLPDCGEDLRQAEFPLNLRIRLTPEAVIRGMGDTAPADAYEFILGLEKEVGLWSLTILLARYFEGQMAIAREKCPELVAATDEELFKEMED